MVEESTKKKWDAKKAGLLVIALIAGAFVSLVGAAYTGLLLFVLVGFLLGKYSEKISAAIRDYRLSLKLDRVHYSQVEYEAMKKEVEALRAMVSNQAIHAAQNYVAPHRPGERERPPAMGQPLQMVDESHYRYGGHFND